MALLKYNQIGFSHLGNQSCAAITDYAGAELGWTWEEGKTIKLFGKTRFIKDYSVTDDGITGTEVDPDEIPHGHYGGYNNTVDGGTDPVPVEHTFTASENPDDGKTYRLAIYCEETTIPSLPNYSGTALKLRWYCVEDETFTAPAINGVSATRYIFITNGLYLLNWISSPSYSSIDFYMFENQILRQSENWRWGIGDNYQGLLELSTNIPVFDTRAHCEAYLQDPDITAGLLNPDGTTPEDAYKEARAYKYIYNIYGHNANAITGHTGFRNYRFFNGDGKICFYREKPTRSHPYSVRLYHYQSYNAYSAPYNDYDDESYEPISGTPELDYIKESIQFASNDFYTVFKWLTNMLVFESKELADMWIADQIDARMAENYNQVSRAYNELTDPGYGNPDAGNDNGYNGQSYVHGARMWLLDSSQLNHFFDDIFDPAHISDILDGTKLFGSNEIGAIQGISYFPLDLDDVATIYATPQSIKIGSYTCPTATGRYVQNNNKMIDCGSVFIAPVYNDFRDNRIQLYISLPYCGVHSLSPISKYMGKNLQVKYAVDITTGACEAFVMADGIYYGDSFSGFMASQRPLTALDQTAYLNSVMGCVSSIAGRETGMLNSAAEGIAGAATGKVSGGIGPGGAIDISMGAIGDLYKLSQAVKETPMNTRGGFAGCLGFFGNQKIHIITIQRRTVKPTGEQMLVGYPSHYSQNVGQFSGYLKVSSFKMNSAFTGTAQELSDINNILSNGIYL